jgi:hypothetical protein
MSAKREKKTVRFARCVRLARGEAVRKSFEEGDRG